MPLLLVRFFFYEYLLIITKFNIIAFAYTLIEGTILPLLLRQYRINDAIAERYLILCTMVAIIQARKIVYGAATGSDDNIDVGHDSILVSYKSKFLEIFAVAIKTSKEHPEIRLMGILGLGLLCVLKNYLTRSEVIMLKTEFTM